MAFRPAPLTTGFFLASIIGFLFSVVYLSQISLPLASAFTVVFICMFIASMISMARATPDTQLLGRPR